MPPLEDAIKWLLFASALLATLTTLGLAIYGNSSGSAITAAFAIFMFLILNISNIEYLKGLGIEARINIKAARVETNLKVMQAITGTFMTISYRTLADTVSSKSISWEKALELSAQLDGNSKIVEVDKTAIADAKVYFRQASARRLANGFRLLRAEIGYTITPSDMEWQSSFILQNAYQDIDVESFFKLVSQDRFNNYIKEEHKQKLFDLLKQLQVDLSNCLETYSSSSTLSDLMQGEELSINRAKSRILSEPRDLDQK